MKQIIIAVFFIPMSLFGQITNETPPDTIAVDSLVLIPEMTIVAKRNTLKRKVDRLEFTVEGTPLQSMNAWEILSNTPSVLVRNESISVRGSDQIIVTINDRKTLMSEEQLKQFLEGTSGDQIYSIEVITNPPAKYEAEGAAVINIKMKQNRLTGYRGSVSARYQQSIYAKGRVGLMQSYNTNKWQLSGTYNFISGDYMRQNFDVVTYEHNKTRWESDMVRKTKSRQMHLYSFSSQYDFDTLSSIRFGVDGNINPKSTGNYYIPTNIYNTETNLLQSYYRTANNRFQKYNTVNAYLSFDRKLKNGSLSWINNFSNKDYYEQQDISTWQNFSGQPESFNRFGYDITQQIRLFSSQVDYRLEKGDFIFESGAKYSLVQNDNQLDFLNELNGNLIQDASRSNHFYYNEQIIAAYVSFEYQLKKWFFKAGLRNEATLIKTTSDNPQVTNETKRNNLFPTFYVMYEIKDNQQIGLSYGRRIDRPVYDFLNPSKSYYNYYSYFQGDPYLKSTLIDNVNLTYTLNDWNFEVYYNFIKNPSMEISIQNPSTFETIYLFTNIKSGQNLGGNFFRNFTLLPNWKLNVFAMGEYIENYFMGIDQQLHRNTVFFYHLNLSTQLTMDKAKTWDLTVGYRYNSKAIQGSFNISASQNAYLMINKKLFDKKMEIGLTINDIFKTDKNTISTRYANQNQTFSDYRDTRYFVINLRYNFGNQKVKEAKSADKTDEQNRL
jgi:hypothetical protein